MVNKEVHKSVLTVLRVKQAQYSVTPAESCHAIPIDHTHARFVDALSRACIRPSACNASNGKGER